MIDLENFNFWEMGWEMFLTMLKMWKLWLPMIGLLALTGLLALGRDRLEDWFDKRWRTKRYKDIKSLERLRGLSGSQFEEFIAHLFEKLGYKIELTGGSHDGGVDVVAIKDGKKHYIQCKKYTNKVVSVGAVRDFYGAIADKLDAEGYFITTQFFTIEAKKFAEGKPVQLIDQFRLLDLMRLAGDEPIVEDVCPNCGKKLVRRNGKFGEFIGCAGYPSCSYTRSVDGKGDKPSAAKLKRLIFVMGASGSGKTHALKKIEAESQGYAVCHFDSLGIPSEAEVKKAWGSWDAWQKMRVDEWMSIILRDHLHKHVTILDGQIRPNHIEEVCKKNGIEDYRVILLDCSDEERVKRLNKRGQPELVNDTLSPWAKFLREECGKRGYKIIDNTTLSESEGVDALKRAVSEA